MGCENIPKLWVSAISWASWSSVAVQCQPNSRTLTSVSFNDTHLLVIRSFRDKTTEAVFNGENPKGFPADLVKVARRKLRYLNASDDLGDLRSPPGNRLEALTGDRKGQHSIRINDQFRVCFVWTAEGPAEVEIVDYH
jgi:proteic killer suppression protein